VAVEWLVGGRCRDGSADLLNDRVGDQEEINKQEREQKADAEADKAGFVGA